MFSITFTGWSYLWATCHSFLIRLSSIEELIVLQETKYTALCSHSIGFYSIEIEQTAYRNILSLQPRTHPQLLLASVTYFMIKKIGTDEMRAETILNLGRLSRAQQNFTWKQVRNSTPGWTAPGRTSHGNGHDVHVFLFVKGIVNLHILILKMDAHLTRHTNRTWCPTSLTWLWPPSELLFSLKSLAHRLFL